MKKSVISMGLVLSVIFLAAISPVRANPGIVPYSPDAMTMIAKNIRHTEALIETAQGYLSQYREVLCKMRELLVMGANGIHTPGERTDMIDQIQCLSEECERILEYAQFNGLHVFDNPDTGESFHIFPVTLSPAESTLKLTISSEKFNSVVLSNFAYGLLPTPLSMEKGIAQVDELLTAVVMEASKLGAYQSRLEYAARFANILAGADQVDSLDNFFIKLNLDLETRLFSLAVQSAGGIFSIDDRKMIQMEFSELLDEMKRIEKLTGIKSLFADLKNPSLLTQKDAEELMILMANKFADMKNN